MKRKISTEIANIEHLHAAIKRNLMSCLFIDIIMNRILLKRADR